MKFLFFFKYLNLSDHFAVGNIEIISFSFTETFFYNTLRKA